MQHLPDVNNVKRLARQLSVKASELGHEICLGHSLELTSVALGQESWNHLSSQLARPDQSPVSQHTVLWARPGDGVSMVWNHYAMYLLDNTPKAHVVITFPYHVSENFSSAHLQSFPEEYKDRCVFLSLSAEEAKNPSCWPKPSLVKGKIVYLSMKGQDMERSAAALWHQAVQAGWSKWSASKSTAWWVDVDTFRYIPVHLPWKGSARCPEARMSVVQMMDDMVALDDVSVSFYILAKSLSKSSREQLLCHEWKGALTVLPRQVGALTNGDLQSLQGWIRLSAVPLTSELSRNPAPGAQSSPLYRRFLHTTEQIIQAQQFSRSQ